METGEKEQKLVEIMNDFFEESPIEYDPDKDRFEMVVLKNKLQEYFFEKLNLQVKISNLEFNKIGALSIKYCFEDFEKEVHISFIPTFGEEGKICEKNNWLKVPDSLREEWLNHFNWN